MTKSILSDEIQSGVRNKTQEFGQVSYQISRRKLLTLFGQGLVGASFLSYFGCLPKTGKSFEAAETPNLFNEIDQKLMEEVQAFLLPSGPDSPGARECFATRYLELAVTGSDIDPDDRKVIPEGLRALEGLSYETYSMGFQLLNDTEKEALLRKYEDDPKGNAWLTLVLSFTLEAFLGDPAYGGNPDGIGWQWLKHTPGFPRPALITIGTRR